MAYQGKRAIIPFGKGGLFTDAPQTDILPLKLIRANNCTLINDCAEKDFGSRRWNETALGTGISHFKDWWPSETVQRVIAAGKNGKIYRFKDAFNSAEVTPTGSAPATLNTSNYVSMVPCGNEESGNNRKLFIFTGNNPVQVISGDGLTRSDIAAPAADWTGTNQPITAVPHRAKLFAFGNRNDPHRVYACDPLDHENFASNGASYSVYPGEGERLVCGFVFNKKLWLLKYPTGLYVLNDSAEDFADWFFEKVQAPIGAAGPNAFAEFFGDVGIGNGYGTITSLQSTDKFGDIQGSDIFNILKIQNFTRNELARGGSNDRYAIYYPDKQQAFFSFRSNDSQHNNRICIVNLKENEQPHVTWNTKDQANCLGLMKDVQGVERPAYGANDGYIYLMDQVDRWVGTSGESVRTAYAFDIQTPHMDLRSSEPNESENAKNFDFLECIYEPCGDWDLLVDVYIDGNLLSEKPLRFRMEGGAMLGQFQLNVSRLDGRVPMSQILPLSGSGRRISLRAYNSVSGENVKLLEFRIYYRISGNQQNKSQG